MKVVLENTSTTTKNQPAEYAIKFYLTIGGTTTTITSDTVIASTIIDNSSLNPTVYQYDKHTPNCEKVQYAMIRILVTLRVDVGGGRPH